MKILTVCNQGNSRSVQFSHLLKYKYKADVIPIGIDNTSNETLDMLFSWADKIILTGPDQEQKIPQGFLKKTYLWDVGGDHYPRPFNPDLNMLARRIIEENPL